MPDRRRALAMISASLVAVTSLGSMPRASLAAVATCDAEPEQPSSRPVAPAGVAAGLTGTFAFDASAIDRQAILSDVVKAVQAQTGDLGLEACFREKPARIASRTDFLSPYEFLVVSMFSQEPVRRDALLDQYRTDPQGAIKALGDTYPSTRAQATLATYAFYDVTAGRIRINTAKVPPAEIRRVLVHEFWHAMPAARTWTASDGRMLRASGFWLQEQRGGKQTWVPIEDQQGLPYAPYLMDEAMATLMETRYAGPSRFARPDLDEVQRFLNRLFDLAGTSQVMADYLHSEPYAIGELAETHRASLPELEPIARP